MCVRPFAWLRPWDTWVCTGPLQTRSVRPTNVSVTAAHGGTRAKKTPVTYESSLNDNRPRLHRGEAVDTGRKAGRPPRVSVCHRRLHETAPKSAPADVNHVIHDHSLSHLLRTANILNSVTEQREREKKTV